jgi:hypothetical protein
MAMPEIEKPIESLGQFTDRVSTLRQSWGLAKHKELWFRGESRNYGEIILRPELYRPPSAEVSLKPIWKLLNIENDLYDEFQRNAVERTDEKTSEEDWDWDSYFLMQHHNGPYTPARLVRRGADGLALRSAEQDGRFPRCPRLCA